MSQFDQRGCKTKDRCGRVVYCAAIKLDEFAQPDGCPELAYKAVGLQSLDHTSLLIAIGLPIALLIAYQLCNTYQ